MKNTAAFIALIALAVLLSGCQSTSQTSAASAAMKNPNNQAKAVQDTIAAVLTPVLAKNPSYAPTCLAAGNVLAAIAASDPSQLTAADLVAAVSKIPNVPTGQAQEVAQYLVSALGAFQNDFGVQFPELKPPYKLFLTAAANGLFIPTGRPTLPLPIIPWPPVAAVSP
jgi:hypothetical protein